MPFGQGGPVTDYASDVGPGWLGLLRGLHIELITIDPGYETVQVKEKFGCLRVYANVSDPGCQEAVWAALGRYEALSAAVCENCGQPGECRSDPPGAWIKTLCGACRLERNGR
jgi:hypothetical protein